MKVYQYCNNEVEDLPSGICGSRMSGILIERVNKQF